MEEEYLDEILCTSIADTGHKCGSTIRRHQKLCNQCGTKVSTSWFLKQTASPQVCTGIDDDGNVCGLYLDFSAKFCSNCGTRSKQNVVINNNYILDVFLRIYSDLLNIVKCTLCDIVYHNITVVLGHIASIVHIASGSLFLQMLSNVPWWTVKIAELA